MALRILVNGEQRELGQLESPATLASVLHALALAADRIAVEKNGEITPRSEWEANAVHNDDRLEIVHFVGGGR